MKAPCRLSRGQAWGRRLAAAAVLVLPAAALAGSAGTPALAAVPMTSLGEPPLSQLTPLASDGSNPVDAFAPAVMARAAMDFLAVYGGVAAVNHGQDLNVYLVGVPSAAVAAAIRGDAPTSRVHFVDTPHSLAQLMALRDRVRDDVPVLAKDGIDITSWGPDVWTGKEQVTVYNLTSPVSATLTDRYGVDIVELVNSTRPTAGLASGTRTADTRPFNAGDFIQGDDPYQAGYVDNCTSGFGAHSGNNYYLLGAQHCYNSGTAITQDSSYAVASGTPIGTVAQVDDNYGGLDALSIATPNDPLYPTVGSPGSSPAIFTAGSLSPQTADVSGVVTSPPGYQVCEDGAYEGEICGLVVQTTNTCINITEAPGVVRYACGEDYAVNPSGGIANGQGDSGSGLFRFDGALLEATGIDSAGSNQIPCQAYTGNGRECFSDVYFTEVGQILNEFALTINT